ncbi:hypothetical protein Tco_0922478 [Tanacetum coccineum]|uniref:Uncharacterized protein n=1 Tax=Tanacetum coccineum TaxID=301880 RepID=A0ABQ5CZ65_9ASTR
MVEPLFSKFKEDKVRMLSVQDHKGMLQVHGEIHQVKQMLSSAIIVKVKGTWQDSVLSQREEGMHHDPGVADGQVTQTIIHNAAFQTDDLDAYDSDCDDISSAKAVLMANLSSCDSYVLSEMANHATNWDKANTESKIVNESLIAELERYKERVKILEERFNVDLSSHENFNDTKFVAFETEIDTLKQTLPKHVQEKEFLLTTLNGFKMEFKQRESKSIDKEIVLENKKKELETLFLNKLSEYFGKCFVPQQELSAEQMFWLQNSNKNSEEPSTSNTPVKIVKIEVPSELPKDLTIPIRSYDYDLAKPKMILVYCEVQTVFTQIEAVVEQCSVDRKCCEIQQKQFLIENDRLLDKIISQDIVNIVLNSSVVICDYENKNDDSVVICNKCLELEAELVKKNDVFIELSKRFSNLEQHFISLKVSMQLSQENFQKDKSCDNQIDPEIQEYFEQNDLQVQLHAKDTVISKLKETIHSLRDNANPARVKQDIDEIETINIELEHSVAKSLFENEKLHKEKEHLKKTYNELYDSIKPTRVHAKEQSLKNELRKLKGKTMINTVVSKPHATTIALGMFKLDLEPLALKVLKNKDAHLDYIKHSREHADIFLEIVKSTRALRDLDSNLDSALIGSTGASGSKLTGNTKNNKISQSSSNNKTNKVEAQSRSVKSRKNKKYRVAKTECNAYVM